MIATHAPSVVSALDEVPAGTRPGRRVLLLGRGEEALGEARVALESALHPLDLEQVDTDSGGHRLDLTTYLVRPTIIFAVVRSPEEPAQIAA